ncbi:putative spermine spermidine synthase family protein [Erysiphe neolycopersici]|uniref:Putative spermine spermidine synthase family protein n=1 Tax=Erysiphe neolycopersici TaxID=212602 RepID=A0A420I3T7_9PEZI|nr:putative spermine spermidine synthase family protein [Erysiphe neolycopersici]
MAGHKVSKSPRSSDKEIPVDPLFTRENFEKELRDLAVKAQEQTWLKWAVGQVWIISQVCILYNLAAISSNVSILNLSPVYGNTPSKIWHSQVTWISCFLGWSFNRFFQRLIPVKLRHILPLIAAYTPLMQLYLFKLSGLMGVRFGPIITESLTHSPLLILTVSVAASLLSNLDIELKWIPSWISDSFPGILSFSSFKTMELFTESKIQNFIGSSFLHSRLGLQVALTGMYSIIAPSKMLLFLLPAVLHTAFFNIHVPASYTTNLLNSSLAAKGWSVLERRDSITGYISVIENHEKKYRTMRCDHSLLGGEWLISKRTQRVAEPIYGVFVMLEAVRLLELSEPILDSEAKAYVVGLGIGTTPAALIEHGIDTTIVEIDPVVYDFAQKHFSLPKNHTVIIADAVSYTAELVQKGQKYDYIIHDVFTGGAEPLELFTVEFIQDLSAVLKPGGVVAINYAGDLSIPIARIIVNTIKSVFPTCRIFRESEKPTPSQFTADKGRDFTNMVLFCTNAANEIKFRKPNDADFLESGARQQFLLPKYEVDDSIFAEHETDGGLLRKNDTGRFLDWQQENSLSHWSLMRTVLPPTIWEMW